MKQNVVMKQRAIKRVLAMVAAMLFTIGGASAQLHSLGLSAAEAAGAALGLRTEWGVGLKGVYTSVESLSPSITVAPRIGFGAQCDMALRIGRRFAIETEIGYERGSMMVGNGSEQFKVKTTTMDIPVLASLRLLGRMIRISAGPLFSVMNKAQYVNKDNQTMEFGALHPTWNIMASAGVCIGTHFLIEARYVHSLKKTLNQFEGEEFNLRSRRITVGVTALF